MQQRRPHSTTVVDPATLALRRQARRAEREEKKLRRIKRRGSSYNPSFVDNPYVQLAAGTFAFIIFSVATVRFLDGGGDDFSRRRKQTPHEGGGGNSDEVGFMNSVRRGVKKYIIPESMTSLGDKSRWYSQLRQEYDTEILPKDEDRSVAFVRAERERMGVPKQHAMAETPYDIHDCPETPVKGYPWQWPVLEVLNNWSPDDADAKEEIYQGLCVFDYRTELHKAKNYRRAEVPFVMRDDPDVARTAERWGHPGYLERLTMGKEDTKRRAEYSPNNHFMYWNDKRPKDVRQAEKMEHKRREKRRKHGDDDAGGGEEEKHEAAGRGNQEKMASEMKHLEKTGELKEKMKQLKRHLKQHSGDEDAAAEFQALKKKMKKEEAKAMREGQDWTPPTENLRMTYDEWIQHASISDAKQGPDDPHWYFRLIGCGEMGDGDCDRGHSEWLFDELTFFQPWKGEYRPFYLIQPEQQKGIHCRFGMKGVIAENHFDASRNAITVLGGQRRYILGHPGECNNMNLLPRGHPSARHSAVDWSDPDLKDFPTFKNAHVNEIIMQPGDVLYLPTNWFHYIISLGTNYQCNTRSGGEKIYREYMEDCGF